MTDERGLQGLDPYDLQDAECARLATWFGQLDDDALAVASGCEGWTRRDVLAHLLAVEEYFEACLAGEVQALMARYMATGATSLDAFNAAGVAAGSAMATDELLEAWIAENAKNRAGFRAADGTDIDTSVGAYPCRPQAFHVAFEYAIHANDVDAPVSPAEREARQDWLAGVARFALTEAKEDVTVEAVAETFAVTRGETERRFDRDSFVAGVSGRSEPGSLAAADADLLGLGY